MSATAALFLLFGIWMLIGVSTALAMGRRGHHPVTWGMLGAAFGPLVIPLAISTLRQHQDAMSETVHAGTPGGGRLDVLVGVDGSDESMTATSHAVDLFGSELRRLTLAAVLDYDTAQSPSQWDERDVALRDLERHAAAAGATSDVQPETILLAGRPADALLAFARDNGYDVLVVGRRGKGAAKALLGSVAEQVSRHATIPVLIVGS